MSTGPMDPKLLKPGMTRSVKEVMCFCTEKFTEADLGEGKEVQIVLQNLYLSHLNGNRTCVLLLGCGRLWQGMGETSRPGMHLKNGREVQVQLR